MAKTSSAKRYAQAAFQLAVEEGDPGTWAEELYSMLDILRSSELQIFLEHAKVPMSKKLEIVNDALPKSQNQLRHFVGLLVSKGLIETFSEICHEYSVLLNKHLGRQPVEVTSAIPLTQEETDRIKTFLRSLTQKDAILTVKVDPDILGGLIIRVGDQLIDGSTSTRLADLKKIMNSESYH